VKELGFVAALVVILCYVTYLMRQPAVGLSVAQNSASAANSTTYTSAIKAAVNAKRNADIETRRRWVLGLQLTASEHPDASRSTESPTYTVEGENSEILVVTSNSMDSGLCSLFANGDYGSAAADEGFTTVSCRNRSTGGVYDVPVFPAH